MKILKTFLLVVVIVILANIPYVGYLPRVFKGWCDPSSFIHPMNCGLSSKVALLNPIFWLPTVIIQRLVTGESPFEIPLKSAFIKTNYIPFQFYSRHPLTPIFSLVFFLPYWVGLSILLRKIFLAFKRKSKK